MVAVIDPLKIYIGRTIHDALNGIAKTSSNIPTLKQDQFTIRTNGDLRLGRQGGIVFEPSSKKIWYPNEFKDFVIPNHKSPHPLSKLILRPLGNLITTDEIQDEVLENVEFDLFCFKTGSIPASSSAKSLYSKYCWTRDMAIEIDAMIELGSFDEEIIDRAIRGVYCLAELYNRKENRSILTSYHWHPQGYQTAVERYRTGDGGHVPIRAALDGEGNLVRSDQPWAHNQLDAMGAWLYATFRLANVLNDKDHKQYDPNFLRKLNEYLSSLNDENNLDSVFSVAFKSLNRIQCWDNFDVGVWEDLYSKKRTSSVAAVLRAAHEARWYFNLNKWDTMPIHDTNTFRCELDQIIENCTRAINERIPLNGSSATEIDGKYWSDAALSFLLYPFKIDLNSAQEQAILKNLYENRMGVIGFTRRDEDDYMGMGYQYNPEGEGIHAYTYVPDYKPAEWTLFDPNLSVFFADKVINQIVGSGIVDEASLELSEFHFRRSLAHITPRDDVFHKRYHSRDKGVFITEDIPIQEKHFPESYSYDPFYKDPVTETFGKWRAVDHCPLLWTEANVARMFKKQLELKSLLEKHNIKIWKTAA